MNKPTKEIRSQVMSWVRSHVKRNARTPEQLRNAIAARWPKRKSSVKVRTPANGKTS